MTQREQVTEIALAWATVDARNPHQGGGGEALKIRGFMACWDMMAGRLNEAERQRDEALALAERRDQELRQARLKLGSTSNANRCLRNKVKELEEKVDAVRYWKDIANRLQIANDSAQRRIAEIMNRDRSLTRTESNPTI